MGFYLRKSIKVGPFRFNVSKSGVGVSAGVKGLRIGTGPRGNYVRMGLHGIYYRATIPSSPSSVARPAPQLGREQATPANTHEPLQEIDSADVAQIVDSTSAELLEELNQKRKKARLWPLVVVLTLLITVLAGAARWPPWLIILLLTLGVAASYLAFSRDLLAKTAVLFYDFDVDMEKAYELLHRCGEQLASCSRAWHIEAEGKVYDPKYHAGASNLVQRKSTFIKKTAPPYVKTNVETVAVGVGTQTLHFFPDRVLVYAPNGVGAVSYSSLELHANPTRFIEDGGVPRDARVVDHTWKYVNKKGGPDRRFKDNRKLAICLYDELFLSSSTGLNEVIQVSKCEVAEEFVEAIRFLAARMQAA